MRSRWPSISSSGAGRPTKETSAQPSMGTPRWVAPGGSTGTLDDPLRLTPRSRVGRPRSSTSQPRSVVNPCAMAGRIVAGADDTPRPAGVLARQRREPLACRLPAPDRCPTLRGSNRYMAKTTVRHVAALFAGLSLLAAACGSDNGGSSDTTGAPATEAPTTEAATATTEAAGASTTAAAAGGDTAGALAGMKGTTPLVELSAGLQGQAPRGRPRRSTGLQLRRRDLRRRHDHRPGRREGAGPTASTTPRRSTASPVTARSAPTSRPARPIIDAGGDPDYDGHSGPLEFAGNGEPLQASYGLLEFGDDNRIDDAHDRRTSRPTRPGCGRRAAGPRRGHPRR